MEENKTTQALYWSFDYHSKSDAAQRLMINMFTSLRLDKGSKNRLSQHQLKSRKMAFDRCLSSLIARSRLTVNQELYRSLDKKSFSKQSERVSHNNFRLIVETMVARGYLTHTLGKLYPEEDFNNPDGSKASPLWRGKASHFAPTLKFLKLVRKYGLKKKGLSEHFGRDKPHFTLEARRPSQTNGRQKLRGRTVPQSILSKDPLFGFHKNAMTSVNEFLFNQNLEGGEFVGLKRVFNNYTDDNYNWDAGGRMYDIDQNGYQKLSEEKRAQMTINGEPVTEIDIEACFLTILLGRLKLPLPNNDMYAIDSIKRPIVKSWMTISLTNGKLLNRWPPSALSKLREKFPSAKMPTANQVREAVLEHYPWLKSLSDKGIAWPQLQYTESTIMLSTVKELMSRNIPAYPVHDSLIVPASKAAEAGVVLSNCFHSKVGIRARVA